MFFDTQDGVNYDCSVEPFDCRIDPAKFGEALAERTGGTEFFEALCKASCGNALGSLRALGPATPMEGCGLGWIDAGADGGTRRAAGASSLPPPPLIPAHSAHPNR